MIDFRIILLAPIQFEENFGLEKEQIIIKSNEIENISTIFDNNWSFLNGNKGYMKDIDGSLNILESINVERNLDLYNYDNFIEKFTTVFHDITVRYTAHLLSDENCNFFVIYDFNFDVDININVDEYLNSILNERDIFTQLDINDFKNIVKEKSIVIIDKVLKKLLSNKFISSKKLKFTLDSSYPLAIVKGLDIKNPTEIFKNEESITQRTVNSDMCSDYGNNSFMHIGWNYGVINNLPKNINQKLLCMSIYLQINYYQLRFYKLYFQNKIQNLASKSTISEKDISTFDKLKISYHKYFLDYRTYRSGLYPKMYQEFKSIEELWHVLDDIDFIDKTFDVQNEYINKTYQIENERNSKKLNTGLSLIAFIQIAAIYGIVKDTFDLKDQSDNLFEYTSYGLSVLLVTSLAFILFPVYNKIKNKGKNQR